MATRSGPVDLDVLPAFGDVEPGGHSNDRGPGPGRSANRRRRHWPWAIVAAVVAGAVIAFPVRARVSAAQLGRLDRRWQETQTLDHQYRSALGQLEATGTTEDSARVAAAESALDGEFAGRIDHLRRVVAGERILDSGMRRLASAEQAALTAKSRSLRSHTYADLDANGAVAAQLRAQRGRFGRPEQTAGRVAPLTSADTTLAALQRWTDTPTGALLIAPTDGRLAAVDVDQSRVTPIEPAVIADSVVARTGYLVVLDDRAVSIVTLEGTHATSARRVGTADYVFPAARPDAFWMVDNAPVAGSAGVTRDEAVEADGQGNHIAHWVGAGSIGGPAQITEEPVAEVGGGLLVQRTGAVGQPNVQIMHLDGSPGPAVTGAAFPMAASARSLAWVDNTTPEHQLHLWSSATGTDRVIPNPEGREIVGIGDFSPDGSLLAASYGVVVGPDDLVQSAVVDIAGPTPGAIRIVPGAGSLRITSSAWSPDGQRLFFAGRGPHPLATYRVGAATVDLLRAHDLLVDRFAVVDRPTPPAALDPADAHAQMDESTRLFGGFVHLRLRDYSD